MIAVTNINVGLGLIWAIRIGFLLGFVLGWFWVGFVISFRICLNWFVLFKFSIIRLVMSFQLGFVLGWIREERKRVSQRESQGQRERKEWERREKIYLNNEIESYNNRVNIHGYRSIFAYAQYYRLTNVGCFLAKMCKNWHFFYFPRIDALTKCFPKRNMTHKICCESVVKILCA